MVYKNRQVAWGQGSPAPLLKSLRGSPGERGPATHSCNPPLTHRLSSLPTPLHRSLRTVAGITSTFLVVVLLWGNQKGDEGEVQGVVRPRNQKLLLPDGASGSVRAKGTACAKPCVGRGHGALKTWKETRCGWNLIREGVDITESSDQRKGGGQVSWGWEWGAEVVRWPSGTL